MVSVVLSERVRPNVPKISTKTAIIHPSPRDDRDTIHARVVSIQHPPNNTPHTFQYRFKANFRRLFLQVDEIASIPVSLLNLYSATRSITRIPDGAPMSPRTTPSIDRHHSHACSNSIVELVDHLYHLQRYSKASRHLPNKCAVDWVVWLLQVDETKNSGTHVFLHHSRSLRTANIISAIEQCGQNPHCSSGSKFLASQ